ncbi:MAG: hypothetical protein SFT93_01275 [Rickettsiaceae bacterium]|nr:hypothetical protein [Rickettsiaceae bacterium]
MSFMIIKSIVVLAIICTLLYFFLRLIQYYGKNLGYNFAGIGIASSIKLSSVSYIDNHTKIIHLKNNNKNYVVMVGKNNNILLDSYEDKNE